MSIKQEIIISVLHRTGMLRGCAHFPLMLPVQPGFLFCCCAAEFSSGGKIFSQPADYVAASPLWLFFPADMTVRSRNTLRGREHAIPS
jgi:hypothetical protein